MACREKEAGDVSTHFTQFGRVEADPLRIPRATMPRARDDFAKAFDAVVDRAGPSAPEEVASRDEPDREPTTAVPPTADGVRTRDDARDDPPEPEPVAEARPAVEREPAPAAAHAATTSSEPRAAQAQQPAAAGDTGERASQPALPVPGTAAPAASVPPAAPGFAPAALGAPALGAGAASGRPAPGGVAASDARAPRTTFATALSGYRSLDRLAVDRLEAARDSVLRQIAFTLRDGTSEARMQLEPPELGALDLQLVVDEAGQTRLSVIAERPEVAALLVQHMPALASTLAQQGLTVAHADVRSQRQRARSDAPTEAAPRAAHGEDRRARVGAPTVASTAHGLDFWV